MNPPQFQNTLKIISSLVFHRSLVIVEGSSTVRDLFSSAAVEVHLLLYPGRLTTKDL